MFPLLLTMLLVVAALPTSAAERWEVLPPTPAPIPSDHSGEANANGISIHYAVYGQGSPVILLHGGLANTDYWGNQIEALAPHHIVGALLGLIGTVLLFAGNSSGFAPGQVPGLIAAFVAAFVWASYSVMSRKLKSVPTDAVAGFCLATALLAAAVHGAIEVTVWPDTTAQWLAIIALGVGPVGAAFYAWDIGMKRGDIRVLGAASYATPLLSTAFLILAGFAKPSATIAIAAVLIAGGGLIAAKDMFWKR